MEKEFIVTRVLYNQILQCLKERKNLFQFAAKKGISMRVVSAVVDGWIPEFPRRGRRPKGWKQDIPETEFLGKTIWSEEYERCPECGGMVHLPCLACEVRQAKKESSSQEEKGTGTLELNLPPDCYQRYLKIKAKKVREELERNCREAEELEKALEEERRKEKERYEKVCYFFNECDSLDGDAAVGERLFGRVLSGSEE